MKPRFHVCGVTCEPHLPECNNYCNMKTICGEKFIGPVPDSPAEIEAAKIMKEDSKNGMYETKVEQDLSAIDEAIKYFEDAKTKAVMVHELVFFDGVLAVLDGIKAKRLTRRSSTVEQNQGWIACSERLPEQGGYYLSVKEGFNPHVSTFFDSEWFDPYDRSVIEPTHWQPLPKAPVQKVNTL